MIRTRVRDQAQFAILPPSSVSVSEAFRNVTVNKQRHNDLMAEMQRFRGKIYAGDGAIQADDLTSDGRHKVDADEQSWHVLALNESGRVYACLRYLEEKHARGFDDLFVRHAALTRSPVLGRKFRTAVETEMMLARQMGIGFGEVGGWAVAADHRWTLEPLRIILATYGLLELLGGCAGVATATSRHSSATMLRRIGLSSLQSDGVDLPPYYDPQYSCEMEVLRFDSRYPNPKYSEWVADLASCLSTAPVICRASAGSSSIQDVFRGFEVPVVETTLAPVCPPYATL
jgi:hypothetical protein